MEFDQRDFEKNKRGGIRGTYAVLAIVGLTGLTAYYSIYKPLFVDREKWKKIQENNRRNIDQTKVQPGGMRVWSSPYRPQPKEPYHPFESSNLSPKHS